MLSLGTASLSEGGEGYPFVKPPEGRMLVMCSSGNNSSCRYQLLSTGSVMIWVLNFFVCFLFWISIVTARSQTLSCGLEFVQNWCRQTAVCHGSFSYSCVFCCLFVCLFSWIFVVLCVWRSKCSQALLTLMFYFVMCFHHFLSLWL